MAHKGYYGQYSGNAKWSKVTNSNMGATKRDDEAHMDYLKQDIKYDNKHGHSDEKMTADEKHISKLAGDLKYDEKKHGSPAKHDTFDDPHEHIAGGTYRKADDKEPINSLSPVKNAMKTGDNKWTSHADLAKMPSKDMYNRHMAGHK